MNPKIIALSALFILIAALGVPAAAQDGGPIVLTEDNNGDTIRVQTGDVLQIKLPANATAGYQWYLMDVDGAILAQIGEADYLAPAGDTMGAGGTSVWQFEAVGPGETTLQLGYDQIQSGDAMPEDVFEITVTVRGGMPEDAPQPADVTLNWTNSGETLTLNPGQIVEIRLAANATTGYGWQVDAVDEAVFQQLGRPGYILDEGSEDLDGVGGTSVWRFGTAAPGETTLRLIYVQGGDDTDLADEFEITVIVAAPDETPAPQADEILFEGSDGETITLSPGQIVEIRLEANATTGYGWQVDAVDETVFQQIGDEEYIRDEGAENMTGVGGTSVWRFEAAAPGETTLRLVYVRAWEEDVEPVNTFEITVIVAGSGETPAPQADVTLTDADNGETITLSPGQIVEIRLEANATTGYGWQVDAVDETVLQQLGEEEYILDPGAENLDGAGGTSVWRFKAAAPGETTLRLVYVRAWEENVEPVNTFEITVIVAGSGETPAPQADVILTDADNGETITLSPGDTLRIELAANATTGYMWRRLPYVEPNWFDITVVDVLPDSPAAEAGIRPGDIIRQVNGQPVQSVDDMNTQISAGGPVTLLIRTATDQVEVTLDLGEGEPPDVERPVIVALEDGMPAQEAGFELGDLVIAMDGIEITSIDQLIEYTQAHGGEEMIVTVRRDAGTLDVPVTPQPDAEGVARMGMGVVGATPSALGLLAIDLPPTAYLTDGYDPVLHEIGHLYAGPSGEAPPGTGGTSIWRFEAYAPGRTVVVLVYVQPGEVVSDVAYPFEITVIVE